MNLIEPYRVSCPAVLGHRARPKPDHAYTPCWPLWQCPEGVVDAAARAIIGRGSHRSGALEILGAMEDPAVFQEPHTHAQWQIEPSAIPSGAGKTEKAQDGFQGGEQALSV